MDYLTNYYKNLCEQLQEKLNILEGQLKEGKYNPVTKQIEGGEVYFPPVPPGVKRAMADYIKSNGGLQNPKIKPSTNNQNDGETDEDIIQMRQTAADQGGIPQDLVNEPIERTKQLPDGRTIRSQTTQPPKVRPKIGGVRPIPKQPLPYPKPSVKETQPNNSIKGSMFGNMFNPSKERFIPPHLRNDIGKPEGETMIPKALDGFKKEQNFNNAMGLVPQTPEQRKRFGMSPFDNRMS